MSARKVITSVLAVGTTIAIAIDGYLLFLKADQANSIASTASSSTSTTASSSASSASSSSSSSTSSGLKDGTYSGKSVSTQWGDVQVQIKVSGGKITTVNVLKYPSDNDHSQQIINRTLSGLQMFVRDVNQPKEIADKYKAGMLIHELGYTDAGHRVGGMVTSHRFTILSNHMADLASFEQGTNWGLCVAQKGAHFLVLDVHETKGHTQITLLHLPDDQWQIFEQVNFQMDSLVSNVREIFEKNLSSAPIPELTTADWLRRCAAPLGIADNGAPFPL